VAQPLLQVETGYAASILLRNDLYLWLLVPAIIVILLNVLVTLPWWTKPTTVSVLLRIVRDVIRPPADDDVRCTIFRPMLFRRSLVEVVMATAAGEQKRKNRTRMKISQGVAGRAYRTGQLCFVPITRNGYNQFMIEFGFTNRELSKFQSDRKSYLCIPIFGEHRKVIAILSFDSKHPDTFTSDRIGWMEYMAPYFSVAIRGG
jgi:putative methionine-R-sulfoxide reductase with GAF domain